MTTVSELICIAVFSSLLKINLKVGPQHCSHEQQPSREELIHISRTVPSCFSFHVPVVFLSSPLISKVPAVTSLTDDSSWWLLSDRNSTTPPGYWDCCSNLQTLLAKAGKSAPGGKGVFFHKYTKMLRRFENFK